MEEQYVTFETAEMLKRAGFDVPLYGFLCPYKTKEYIYVSDVEENHNAREWTDDDIPDFVDCCSRPSQAVAAKWLREKHKLHVYVEVHECSMTIGLTDIWYYSIFPIGESCIVKNCICGKVKYSSYEKAMEEGIREVVGLILQNSRYREAYENKSLGEVIEIEDD